MVIRRNYQENDMLCSVCTPLQEIETRGKDWPSSCFSAGSVCNQLKKAGERGVIGRRLSPCVFETLCVHCTCTDKKDKKSFLICQEIQKGAVAKSYMRKGFLIYEEMRKFLGGMFIIYYY
jgi:hypothetical protein